MTCFVNAFADLELRKYKNDTTQKKSSSFEIAFSSPIVKKRESFLAELSRSYNVLEQT